MLRPISNMSNRTKSLCLILAGVSLGHGADLAPAVFPLPQEMTLSDGGLVLTQPARILLPEAPTAHDVFLARELTAELSDRLGYSIRTARVPNMPAAGPVIIMGVHTNPLVRQLCTQRGLAVDAANPGPEGYVLHVDRDVALVAGSDEAGAFYGLQSLRQLLQRDGSKIKIRGARIRDWPHTAFRGIRLYLPGQENIAFFKRFLRNFMALYKFNRVIIEMNAGMRFDRHPELNAGWREFAKDLIYSRRERPSGPGDYFQNSSHHDTADGGVLEKAEVAEIVAYARQQHIDVIPEIPSLTHSFYLLSRHRELAEIQDAEWPDTYCPADPRSYELLFGVLDEFIEVMKPQIIHIGHDEWRMPTGLDPRCKDQDIRDLFVQDIVKIHGYLAQRGVATMLWGDHFMENLRGVHVKRQTSHSGYIYDMPGALTPDQVRRSIPKDIVVLNWFWDERSSPKPKEGRPAMGEVNDAQLSDWGFRQAWGNLTPELSWQNYAARSARSGVLGGAISSWAATTEFNFGKDLMWTFLGTENMLWSKHWPTRTELSALVQALMPAVRRNLSGLLPPSDEGDPCTPVDCRAQQTASVAPALGGLDPMRLKAGSLTAGGVQFQLTDPAADGGKYAVVVSNIGAGAPGFPSSSAAIPVGADVTSLVFLHALAKPAGNQNAYRLIHDFPDSADLLGWYEIVYADGFTLNVPIRYGVNILEWNRGGKQAAPERYCYGADAVEVGASPDEKITFFACEWVNPRLGKVIKEFRLQGSRNFTNTKPFPAPLTDVAPIASNAILLRAVSAIQKRTFPDPIRATTSDAAP